MTVAVEVETIKARARRLYEAGVCPGCGADLVKVAGVGERHYLGGQRVATGSGFRTTVAGELIRNGGRLDRSDPRLCDWTADELTVLVHLGSGLVGS